MSAWLIHIEFKFEVMHKLSRWIWCFKFGFYKLSAMPFWILLEFFYRPDL